MRNVVLCATAAGMLALSQGSIRAATFAVDDVDDAVDASPGDGICATGAGNCTLRAAVQESNALAGTDQITLAAGVHELSIAGTNEDEAATGDLDITDDVTIAGVNAYLSIIDGNSIDRVLDQVAPDAPIDLTLRDLTITGGDAPVNGGGLYHSSNVDAERIIVTRNVASFNGGGISGSFETIEEPALALRYSIVSLNQAQSGGGGIESGSSSGFVIERSIIIANTAGSTNGGGGLRYSDSGDELGQLDELIVYGNNLILGAGGPPLGGGIRSSDRLIVDQSWIGHNLVGPWGATSPSIGGAGGGLFMSAEDDDESLIINTTIEGNLADIGGGLSGYADVTITHATIARNAAEPGSGGLAGSSVRLENTIVAENTPQNCAEVPISLGHNLSGDDSCNLAAGGDIEDGDPQLGTLGDYGGLTRSIPPLPGSVAIEGGTDAGIDVDQRGIARPQLVQFDIGALELQRGRARQRHKGGFAKRLHRCDLDRNGRVDFADLDRLIASFPVMGGRFRGDADRRLKDCVASCTHAGCPAVALIRKPQRQG